MRRITGFLVLVAMGYGCADNDDFPPPPAPSLQCDNVGLANTCSSGRCHILSDSKPLPPGTLATVQEIPIPPELANDASGQVMCHVELPPGTQAAAISLSIDQDTTPADGSVLFQHFAVDHDEAVPASGKIGGGVDGYIAASGDYGSTVAPTPWGILGHRATEVLSSTDIPTSLRNLASDTMVSAFYDGNHLYLGDAGRILVYDGIPTQPGQKPSVVIGQPDFDTNVAITSASLFGAGGGVYGVWSDGHRLAAITGNRVLIWQQIPSAALTPADIVLGQPDFTTNKQNAGGISANSFFTPQGLASDGTHLAVGDSFNHRVLEWNTFPTASGQLADIVIGQPDFTSGAAYSGTLPMDQPQGVGVSASGVWVTGAGKPGLAFVASPTTVNPAATFPVFGWKWSADPGAQLGRPSGVVILPSGAVGVRDYFLERVGFTRAAPTGPSSIDFEIGQPDTTRAVGTRWASDYDVNPARVTASTLSRSYDVTQGGGKLILADAHRTLIYDTLPTYNGEPASRVVGQPGFTVNERSDYRTVSAETMANPTDVSVSGGLVAVADKSNNRVLLFHSSDVTKPDAAAFAVVGQPDGASFTANKDIVSPSATTLSGPEGVILDGKHLIVADTENHRVLIWNAVPQATGAPADLVLGQADFAGRRPNRGRGDVSPVDGFSDVDADGFFYPTGVASDGTHLFVSDKFNHRVLVWDTFPTASGQAASRVLGQPSMASVGANRGAGAFAPTPDGLNLPTGLALVGSTLWIADTENNRVVRWDHATSAQAAPSAWIGQPDGTTVANPNYNVAPNVFQGDPLNTPPPTTSASVLRPRGVSFSQGKLFVAESDSNRVHAFDAGSLQPLFILGQESATEGAPNSTGVGPATLADPAGVASDGTSLFVADARNHRVVGYPLTALSAGAPATLVIGQASLLSNGFNQSSVAAAGATQNPQSLVLDGNTIFIADTGNNRILADDVTAQQWLPSRVWGEPDDKLALPNAGADVSAHGLRGPRGVAVTPGMLFVADTENNRVLGFDRSAPSGDAALVLGQTGFTSAGANAGGASAATMRRPSGVCTDGTHLAVADTSNHRVLLWNAIPSSNGQKADLILGQASGDQIGSNRGSADATAASMATPSTCMFSGGVLYVADSGNNRVLTFSSIPSVDGAPADGQLGQPDLTTRTPAAASDDTSHLAGPVALAQDGANIYVNDRDLGRVVAFSTAGAPPQVLGGINSGSLLRAGAGIVVTRGSLFTSTLYVSETASNRVSIVSPTSRIVRH